MEFSTRGIQRGNEAPRPAAPAAGSPATSVHYTDDVNKSGSGKKDSSKSTGSKVLFVLSILLSISLLVLAIVTIIGIATRTSERSYVDKEKYQAVFLDGGQVYFGRITELNGRYMTLNDIFYLNVSNSTVQPDTNQASNQSISLVKLGCELHGPNDTMIINRDTVTFWENLKSDGKVVTAITDWAKKNPDGQKCETASAQNNTSSNTGTNTTNTTNTTTNTSTNKTTTSGN